jgi:hypothetical protein
VIKYKKYHIRGYVPASARGQVLNTGSAGGFDGNNGRKFIAAIAFHPKGTVSPIQGDLNP